MKKSCCKSFKSKGKACKKCPVIARLSPKKAAKLLKKRAAS